MRRNAESLLVLSGAGQARQWSESIPILDVVRAASGEIADFSRDLVLAWLVGVTGARFVEID